MCRYINGSIERVCVCERERASNLCAYICFMDGATISWQAGRLSPMADVFVFKKIDGMVCNKDTYIYVCGCVCV